MKLSDVFSSVAHKELVAVDLPKKHSNQHEFNGDAALKEMFGTSGPTHGEISWHYFSDEQDPVRYQDKFTFYDPRAKSAHRTGRKPEWRLYYYGDALLHAKVGDLLVLSRFSDGRYFGLVFERTSSWCRAIRALLDLPQSEQMFGTISHTSLDKKQLEFIGQQILAELGLDFTLPAAPSDEALVMEKFGRIFPSTRVMSAFARSQVEVNLTEIDDTLVRWLEREEQLFRALENVVIRERLELNFTSVDEFISYSLSVQNRRKSRMGHALQNHLSELFQLNELSFSAQARTEHNNKPDFLFPGEDKYHNPAFDSALLTMLGVKSSSKDRWRQILTEADRIPNKHLCTLEAGISTKQTEEMLRQHLTLVIPASLHATYTVSQRSNLLCLADFVAIVRRKQMM